MPASSIPPHLFVIFGASGDLTRRKLLPAFYHLLQQRGDMGRCVVLGTSRSTWSDDDFRQVARDSLKEAGFSDGDLDAWCDQCLHYHSSTDDDQRDLAQRVEEIERAHDLPGNRVFYLALPPTVFGPVIQQLGDAGLNESDGFTRLVIEKPFGNDLDSARELNALVHQYFDEEQVYRIDHYLGKETVQNLMAFRFANAIFESVWNRDRIEQVEITVSEDLGVGARAGYYDASGALRDMVQNHLTQLLCLMAMEAPAALEADAIRQEKLKVLRAVLRPRPEDVVLGQYAAGALDGQHVPAYRDEKGVDDGSETPTYAALELHVSNWRWQGVPFYLRTGKRLPTKRSLITVTFRRAPVSIFRPHTRYDASPNVLLITLQPDEGFDLRFEVKTPGGSDFSLATKELSFRYDEAFPEEIPEAYETLLRDVLIGDQLLFVRSDEVEASWKLHAPLLEADLPLHSYPAGSWGPDAARELLPDWTNDH